jgi:hypothetical protein
MLVATTVALHSVLGCCWHHAHAWETSACESAGCEAEHEHDHESASTKHEASEAASHDGSHVAIAQVGPITDPGQITGLGHSDCEHHAADPGANLPAASCDKHEDQDELANEHFPYREHRGPCPSECPGECADQCGPVGVVRVQLEFQSPASLPPALISAWPVTLDLGLTAGQTEAAHQASAYPPHERLHLLRRLLLI